MAHTEYTATFDLLETGGRCDDLRLEMAVTFDIPFTPGLDVPTIHTEDISAVRWEMYDHTHNRALGGGAFRPAVSDGWNWAATFRDMLAANAGLMGELERHCHDASGDTGWEEDRGAA